MKLYFAHPVGHYSTDYERECLDAIHTNAPEVEVLNPAGDEHTVAYRQQGFCYFTNLVASSDGVVAAPYRDGNWGMGVFTEMMSAYNSGKPVFQVLNGAVQPLTKDLVEVIRPLSIVETRARTKGAVL